MARHILYLGRIFLTVEMEKIERKLGNRKGKSWLRRLGFVFLRDRSIFIHLLSLLVLLSPLVISTQGHMSPFPLTTTKHDRCKTKDVPIILYCSCRMPWQKADDSDSAMQMAQCDHCLEWFHRCCENIPDNIFVNDSFWECYKCQKKVKIPAHVNSM